MSAIPGLATPSVEVNDQVISIKPNSLNFKGGAGELTVRFQSSGGDGGENVITEDAETKISMCKFSLISTVGNIDLYNEWLRLSRRNGVVIRLSASGFTRVFRNMRVTTEAEINIGTEGDFEAEFLGDPSS